MSARDTYLLGDSPVEIDHLNAQAVVYADEATALLDRVGVTDGWATIDVGCGVLGILHLLASRVGSRGRTVGLDREERILEQASALLGGADGTVELVHADATSTGLPSDAFDFTHARTLLLNVSDPRAVLAEMVRITRPGGIVAVQEPDAAGWVCDPPHAAWDTVREAIVDAYRANGKDFNIGRRASRLLRDAGLRDVHVRPTARATHAGEYYQTFLLTVASLVGDEIANSGRLRASQLDDHLALLRDHLNDPATITLQPVMWQAWGTKPPRGERFHAAAH